MPCITHGECLSGFCRTDGSCSYIHDINDPCVKDYHCPTSAKCDIMTRRCKLSSWEAPVKCIDENDCSPGRYCSEGSCKLGGVSGAPCTSDIYCSDGYSCFSFKCTRRCNFSHSCIGGKCEMAPGDITGICIPEKNPRRRSNSSPETPTPKPRPIRDPSPKSSNPNPESSSLSSHHQIAWDQIIMWGSGVIIVVALIICIVYCVMRRSPSTAPIPTTHPSHEPPSYEVPIQPNYMQPTPTYGSPYQPPAYDNFSPSYQPEKY